MLSKRIINVFAGGLVMLFAVGESYAQVTKRTGWSLGTTPRCSDTCN